MSFLKSNSSLLKSLKDTPLRRGEELGRTFRNVVHVVGKTHCGIELVLKEGIERRNTADVQSFHYQLSFLNFLYKEFPERHNQLSKVFGLVRDTQGTIGILTDRFPDDMLEVGEYDEEVFLLQNALIEKGLPEIDTSYIYPSVFKGPDGIRFGDLTLLAGKAIIAFRNETEQQKKLLKRSERLERYSQLYTINGTVN